MDYQGIILLIIGFSLIILIHEGGHFLAAKYVGIKVEQFALGFGQAIFSWRKGLGFRAGSSEKEYLQRLTEHVEATRRSELQLKEKVGATSEALNHAAKELGIGETEYRWNWVPLGGYVKMMGQDDTKPGMVINDPRSYTSKSVGARMLVISAGVIMNIIFAGIAFMILFMVGLKVPTAVVGSIIPMAPAQFAVHPDGTPAPLQVGDKLLSINNDPLYNDFRKIALNTALAHKGDTLSVQVQRVDGKVETVQVTPRPLGSASGQLLGIGVGMPSLLEGPDLPNKKMSQAFEKLPASERALGPGDVVTAVQGLKVTPEQFYILDRAVQENYGKPVEVTIASPGGQTRTAQIAGRMMLPATEEGLVFAGMAPRPVITGVRPESSAFGKLQEGDIVLAISVDGDQLNYPTSGAFIQRVKAAGDTGAKITFTVLRDGKEITVPDLVANVRIERHTFGLGIGVETEDAAVMSEAQKGSPAAAIPPGSAIQAIDGVAVKTWGEVLRELRKAKVGQTVTVSAQAPLDQAPQQYTLALGADDVRLLANLRYAPEVLLNGMTDSRTTRNPLQAAWWGVTETRDSILQVYVTLRRLFEGSVPFSGLVGPIGMAHMGVQIASQGVDYLLWFLAIISANLAVVNFLPIPVVDGGHFLFLTIEKLRGKPVPDRIIAAATWCGLALIGFVFLAVTYQDILRMLTVH